MENTTPQLVALKSNLTYPTYVLYRGEKLAIPAQGYVPNLSKSKLGKLPAGVTLTTSE